MARHGKGIGCINVGMMQAGEGRNVIPVHAQVQLEVRGETAEINDFMVDQANRIVKGTALAYDVEYEVEKVGEAGELNNDPELAAMVTEAFRAVNALYSTRSLDALRISRCSQPA